MPNDQEAVLTDSEMRRVRASIRRLARAMNTLDLPGVPFDGMATSEDYGDGLAVRIVVGLALHIETGRKIGDMPATILGLLGEYAETAMDVHKSLDMDAEDEQERIAACPCRGKGVARVRVRAGTYRHKDGYHIVGRSCSGGKVGIFCESEPEARRMAQEIKDHREPRFDFQIEDAKGGDK